MIALTVNGEPYDLETTTVESLIEALGIGSRGIAVTVNAEVIARSLWKVTSLVDGDRIEVLRAAQGGC
jgi:sulfur carrier protein